jgi:hypothetical protein
MKPRSQSFGQAASFSPVSLVKRSAGLPRRVAALGLVGWWIGCRDIRSGQTEQGPVKETDIAVDRLLDEFRGKPWFIDQFWPENSRRALMMLSDARSRLSPQLSKVLDIGCANGYLSSLFAMHGFKVTATDSLAIIDAGDIHYRGPAQGWLTSKSILRPG